MVKDPKQAIEMQDIQNNPFQREKSPSGIIAIKPSSHNIVSDIADCAKEVEGGMDGVCQENESNL